MSITFTFSDDYFENYTTQDNLTTYIVNEDLSPYPIKLPEPTGALVIAAIGFAIFLLAVPGNLLVGWVIATSRHTLSPSDVYLFHLTIADGLIALTVPFSAVSVIYGWVFGDFMCKLLSLIFEANFYTSIIFLACISIDRYLVIVRASETLKSRKRKCSWILCTAVWALGSGLSLPALFHKVIELNNETNTLICFESYEWGSANSWRIAVRGFHHIFGFFLPLAVMINCYSITIARLLHTRGFQKHRAMRVILLVVTAFLLCWTPYHITRMVDTLLRMNVIPNDRAVRGSVTMALTVTHSLAMMHSCINPVLYAFVGEKFRKNMMLYFQRTSL